jgi:hypothetical protein
MKRFAVILLVALAGAAVANAAASAPRAHLRNFVCQRGLDPAQRTVSVDAQMRPIAHTQKMAIRFELVARIRSASSYSAIHGGDLGTWLSPADQPTLGQRPGDVWLISHPVAGLPAPATYRYRVTFRWSGDRGHVLATRTLTSDKCFQAELRPDLLVASIASHPVAGQPNSWQYAAVIRNGGATAAGRFVVTFTPGSGATATTRLVQRLEAHGSRQLWFTGPACTATTAPTVVADPNHSVDDFNLANNSLAVPSTCPPFTSH